jgi:hypothetical protein
VGKIIYKSICIVKKERREKNVSCHWQVPKKMTFISPEIRTSLVEVILS